MKLIFKLEYLSIFYLLKCAYCQNSVYESTNFSLNYTDNVDSTDFVITSKTGSTTNVYYSFGLSNDQNMVTICAVHMYNQTRLRFLENNSKLLIWSLSPINFFLVPLTFYLRTFLRCSIIDKYIMNNKGILEYSRNQKKIRQCL